MAAIAPLVISERAAGQAAAEADKAPNPLPAVLPPLLPGDVILIGADLGWMRTAARWSGRDRRLGHAGIVVPVIGGEPAIINTHGTPFARKEHVDFDAIDEFLINQTRVGIYRPRPGPFDLPLAALIAPDGKVVIGDLEWPFSSDFSGEERAASGHMRTHRKGQELLRLRRKYRFSFFRRASFARRPHDRSSQT